MTDPQWKGPIERWTAALGADGVIAGGPELDAANRTTFAHAAEIAAVLRPRTREQVAQCMSIAAETRVPLYPVSRGCNWGYGSRRPVHGHAALLSLERLQAIGNFDAELGLVDIEPGVSFAQLAEFLKDSSWWPPQTGAGTDNSVVGNALERGIGKGPYEDMSRQLCGTEVLLANGSTIRTGSRRASAAGPTLGGLFSQSNLGVIIGATLTLHPRPRHHRLVWGRGRGVETLTRGIDALRPLLQRWTSGREIALLNASRVQAQNWALPDKRYKECVAADVHDAWLLGVTLWSDEMRELDLRIETLWRTLGGLFAERAEARDNDPFTPSWSGLKTAYWAKPTAFPDQPDPDRDRCGVIWIAPVFAMRGAAVASALSQISNIMRSFGFPAGVSLRLDDGRNMKAIIPIVYDRDQAGADDRAKACRAAVHDFLRAAGLLPYRLSVADMGSNPADAGAADLLQAIKTWADPHSVIAPGRYIA